MELVDDLGPGPKGARVTNEATVAATVISAELVRITFPFYFTEGAAIAGFLAGTPATG